MSIRFEMVSKRYAEGREALVDISFEIGYGEMVYVTGHSGAGKSTLLKLLALIERPSDGHIEVFSKRLADIRRRGLPAYRRRLGLVFQDHRLLVDRNAFDNVALPMRLDGVAEAEIALRVPRALDQVGLGGTRIAHCLASCPRANSSAWALPARWSACRTCCLADEPTGNLDPKLAAEIMLLMISLKEQGTTVIIASHDLPLIQRMRKRTLVLDRGRLIDDFRPEDWYGRGE
jgi:cell division transport system ATP-binding protein